MFRILTEITSESTILHPSFYILEVGTHDNDDMIRHNTRKSL